MAYTPEQRAAINELARQTVQSGGSGKGTVAFDSSGQAYWSDYTPTGTTTQTGANEYHYSPGASGPTVYDYYPSTGATSTPKLPQIPQIPQIPQTPYPQLGAGAGYSTPPAPEPIDFKQLFNQAIEAQKPALQQATQDMLRDLAIRNEARGLTHSGIAAELERKSEQGLQNYFAQNALQQALQMAGLNLQQNQMMLPYTSLTAAQQAQLPLQYFSTLMPWMTTTPGQQQEFILNLLNTMGVVPGSPDYNDLYREIEGLLSQLNY